MDADVLLLQETWPEQTSALAASLNMAVIALDTGPFRNRLDVEVPPDATFGNAIVGRLEAQAVDPLHLPTGPDTAHRVAIGGIVTTPEGALGVVSTHLTHMWDRSDVRISQLDAIAQWVAAMFPPTIPVVVGGDFNLVPNSPEYQRLVETGWVDLSAANSERGLLATMDPTNPNLRDTAWMDIRNGPDTPAGTGVQLDYMAAAPGRPPIEATSLMVVGRGTDHPWPSDHLGLVAELVW